MIEDLIRTGYIITIEEVWTKDHSKGFWIAKDTGGRVCHAPTAEEAVVGVREMFWKDLLKSCPT
jgi:ribulose bisphosphate carboxylase small subunit